MAEPSPGTIGLTKISGWGGRLISALQWLNGDGSEWTHAFILLDDGTIFEADSSGSRIRPLDPRWRVRWVGPPLTDEQRSAVVAAAREHVDIGYNWTTYFYLAAYRLRLPLLTKILRDRVSNSRRLICSQAVDHIYLQAGVHLFNDGRLPFDVTPGDLARLPVYTP